ncbi:riboflavin biosynthesis protein RibF [Candidatus Phycosocius bacilliformis]|uniref:Riboflavin biosynthesis protein n=1 Tax=Candidatus Phycosocius bacilliformis TaxID=1445552 RepID=A0A2P2E9N9_9PROT|nr:riboflavin biosynthesis protein RibF [Candidatus Phycosocius bacilliformis]GBF57781.1 riboflavin biosynthesis protein RibF [Candidatus Phycosocius bacilliformis]
MQSFSARTEVPEQAQGATMALGAFDGLHLGHVAVLRAAQEARPDRLLAVAAFEPPPKCYFAAPESPSFRLNTPRLRAERAADVGAEFMFEIPFDAAMAGMAAADFIRDILVGHLKPCHVTVGHDFRFGCDRRGDGAMLRAMGEDLGFGVTIVEPVLDHSGIRYSSTRVREALKAGHLAMVTTLLGRPWRVEGMVIHGEKRGRTIGFPTANFHLEDQLAPRFGVYAVRVNVLGDPKWYSGVANFGRTPTTGLRQPLFEVNLFDFEGDLYGKRLEVGLHAFLRPEMKFPSLDDLVSQIGRDADEAAQILSVVA